MPNMIENLQTAITQAVFDAKIDDKRLVVRNIFDTDTYYLNQPVPGHKIAVPLVENAGAATQIPHGEDRSVGESDPKISMIEYPVITIKSRFRVSKDEIKLFNNANKNGFLLPNVTELKIQNIRRQIDVEEEKIVVIGSSVKEDCKGLVYSERAYQEKLTKSWLDKSTSNQDILAQLTDGLMYMQEQGITLDDVVLMVSNASYAKLMRPYSDMNSMSLLSWIKNESGLNLDENRVYLTNIMNKKYIKKLAPMGSIPHENGAFVLVSRNPQDVSLGTVQDIQVNEMAVDPLGGYRGSCDLDTAGVLIKYSGAVYVGLNNEA